MIKIAATLVVGEKERGMLPRARLSESGNHLLHLLPAHLNISRGMFANNRLCDQKRYLR